MAPKSVKLSEGGAWTWQTEHSMDKCVGTGGTTCTARVIPSKMIWLFSSAGVSGASVLSLKSQRWGLALSLHSSERKYASLGGQVDGHILCWDWARSFICSRIYFYLPGGRGLCPVSTDFFTCNHSCAFSCNIKLIVCRGAGSEAWLHRHWAADQSLWCDDWWSLADRY